MKDFFNVVRVARDDFKCVGLNGDNLTDSEMERIASKMGDILVENYFWEILQSFGEEYNLPAYNDDENACDAAHV